MDKYSSKNICGHGKHKAKCDICRMIAAERKVVELEIELFLKTKSMKEVQHGYDRIKAEQSIREGRIMALESDLKVKDAIISSLAKRLREEVSIEPEI